MSVSRVTATLVLLAAFAAAAAPAAAQQPTTTRASLSSSGAQAANTADVGEISADGRLVVFDSTADNLVPGDTNGTWDVFARDRVTGVTSRVSVGPGGAQGDFGSVNPEMADDGRTALFESSATNLVPGLPAGATTRLYLADLVTGTVRLLPGPPEGAGTPFGATLSRDGRRYAFVASQAGNSQVFTGDVAAGTVRRVSQTPDGTAGNGSSTEPALSGDGTVAAFTTGATNLTPNDVNGFRDIVAADLQAGTLERASVPSGAPTQNSNLHSSEAALSGDGCVIAFRSDASNLVTLPPGSSGTPIYVRDRCTAATTVASVDNTGAAGGGTVPAVSLDGCLIAFLGTRVNPAPGAGNAAILRDRCSGVTTRLDVNSAGEPGAGNVVRIALSGTGRYAVLSTASVLAPDDTAGVRDVYVRDRATNTKPVAALDVTTEGRTVTAVAEASKDPDGPTLTGTIAWGDGSADTAGLRASHTYARGGGFAVTLTVTDADGATATKTVPVTLPDPVVIAPTPVPTGTPAPPPAAKPRVSGAALSATRFKVAAKGKGVSRGRGTSLRLTLSTAATVRVRVDRALSGRRKGRRCVAGRRSGRRCTRFRPAGSLSRALGAGPRTVAITGRFGRKSLKPGRYRLRVDASSAAGRSAATTLSFTVI